MQRLASKAQEFAFQWLNRDSGRRMRIVIGSVGTGKSHTARALNKWATFVAHEAWVRQWHKHSDGLPRVVRVDWSVVASPESCVRREFDDWCQDVSEASMIILDDVGTETDQFKSGVPTERLTHVLNRCEGKFVWINTNVGPEDWSKRWDARVEDRLLAGECITVNAPSYRSEIDRTFQQMREKTA